MNIPLIYTSYSISHEYNVLDIYIISSGLENIKFATKLNQWMNNLFFVSAELYTAYSPVLKWRHLISQTQYVKQTTAI